LLNLVENFLFTMVVKPGMLPSLFWRLQSMRECRLHRTSWAVECPHQSIDRNRNLVFSCCDITNLNFCCQRNWNYWKVVSLRKIWHKSRGMQNSARRGKRISSGTAEAAGVPFSLPYVKSDVRIARQIVTMSGLQFPT
jgi:hypothetical protein